MSTQTLSSVAIGVVGQYSQVGKIIVGTYRTGAQRLVEGANTRYVSFLTERKLPLVNDAVKARLLTLQQKFVGLVDGGITTGSDGVDKAIDLVAGGVNGSIERIAATTDRVQTAFDTTALSTVGALTLPVAQVSLAIASRAVEGTKRLSDRVIGVQAVTPEVAVKAKRVVKKAVVGAKAAAKRSVKARG